ncbi:YijD family membrane protein [Vibrio sp. SM6]|uniref:YijD family membrane protein n=1 Tax=Vibrio agarilyticus TaxID=2726741 RepID=A0A7X8TS62_9VIBR|nr:YijD family membrane protein [Vibrio agarilyticus]NLS13622.1 YijD family membrane protein [Vibrio agarilyticus]
MSSDSTNRNLKAERKTYILAVIIGMCGNSLLSWVTISDVTFSIFPWIALILALQALYQEYLRQPLAEDVPLIGLACFFIGAFGHSAFVKALYPAEGQNFFAILVVLALLAWVGVKLGVAQRKSSPVDEKASQ